jgi:membrane protein YqaA with SNARE-associated domain
MLRRIYDLTMAFAAHRRATWALAAVAFAESSFFPIPPDVLLIPMVLANRDRAWLYASIGTVASVIGGVVGWLIGALLYTTVAEPILHFYGLVDQFASFSRRYNDYGIWIVFFAGLTPFPYKVITIASGATGLAMPVFIVASIVSRGLRFFAVAGLLWWLGPPIRDFIERRLGLMFTIFVVLLFGGFIVARYLV